MTRLIDADALKEAIEKNGCRHSNYFDVFDVIDDAPTVEPDIIPIKIKDGNFEFWGSLDKNRQLIYAKPYTAEYVKNVLGMSWREVTPNDPN